MLIGNRSKNTVFRSKLVVILAIIAILIGCWLVFVKPKSNTSVKDSTKSTVSNSQLHSSDEAVKTVESFYPDYLVQKAQVVAKVGDNQNVEPAFVQVVRANKDFFTDKLYQSILGEYMAEYQASGKVTKDEVVCVNNVSSVASVALGSKLQDSAVINLTLALNDGTTKNFSVTIELSTLQVSKIACNT